MSDLLRNPTRPVTPSIGKQIAVHLRLIGQMEARTVTGEDVLPTSKKTRALLAVVALSAPRPALRGRLAELLWSRRPDKQARSALRQEIHRLLEALAPAKGEILLVTRDNLTLRPGAVWVDVEEVKRATTEYPASLSLLDGDLLEDLDGVDPSFDAWLTAERERLRDRACNVAEALLREQLEPESAMRAAQQLLQIDRAHEGAWRALMRAHAARGERGMAIQAYDRCRAVLADLLDIAPSQATQKLLTEIRGSSDTRISLRPPAPLSLSQTEVADEKKIVSPPQSTSVLELISVTETDTKKESEPDESELYASIDLLESYVTAMLEIAQRIAAAITKRGDTIDTMLAQIRELRAEPVDI